MEKTLLGLSVRSYQVQHDSHDHGYSQLVIPFAGTLLMDVAGRQERLKAGQVAVVASGVTHTQSGSSGNGSLILDVASERLNRPESLHLFDKPFHVLPAAAMKLVEYRVLMQDARAMTPDNQQWWGALFLDALQQAPQAPASRLLHALLAVERDPAYPWTVASMAERAALSVSRFHSVFRGEMHCTPQQWLGGLRLKLACQLLVSTSLPVNVIACRCGYADQSAFTRAFTRAFQQTPSGHRASVHKQQ